MKNGTTFILGLFAALTLSWAVIVMGANIQLGSLPPYSDDADTSPAWFPGVANQGLQVYRSLGCAECHTQQVRRPDFGSDTARGWGDRQSVARDYIYQTYPQLGYSRIGPDLANLAGRKPSAPDEEDLLKMLYSGSGSMPAYRFLFDIKPVLGEVSDHALKLVGAQAAPRGMQIVPSPKALALVAYLRSLNMTADYPESRPVSGAPGEGEAPKPAAAAAKPGAPAAAATPAPGAPAAPKKEGPSS